MDMTNTGKVLIIALVLVDLGFVAYQFLPRNEHSQAASDTQTATSSSTAAVDSGAEGAHVIAGNVMSSAPSASSSGLIASDAQARPQLQRHRHAERHAESAQTRESTAARPDNAPLVNHARDDLRHGSNAVAAAMTEQLVRESSKPDPSLPMPPPTQTPAARPGVSAGEYLRGSNPVAAAMTQELVRESARVNPASQASAPGGTH